ncbi:MAG: M15 family metallopeptidase [Halothiobacillaceae bacterium]|jgi:D-alanyl-D-alanine dipeptidase|nr:M15 family metallopeptidase [Halothiobacillaceae bacterium]MDY0050703.1 M15 family metallopeptidase [Halothiobacillaceae bacterium]
MRVWAAGALLCFFLFAGAHADEPTPTLTLQRPALFVNVHDVAPDVLCQLRYLGADNFVGAPVEGYRANRCLLTRPAAEALARVDARLASFGLGLHLFDAYRPQRAVDHFVRWAQDVADTRTQAIYYPRLDKARLFPEGYIAKRSGHSRGSTVDVTLIERRTGQPLPMGTPFDFFGPESWPDDPGQKAEVRAHRLLLRTLMQSEGFMPYAQEWWHFTLGNEPFPDTYFDFPVE